MLVESVIDDMVNELIVTIIDGEALQSTPVEPKGYLPRIPTAFVPVKEGVIDVTLALKRNRNLP